MLFVSHPDTYVAERRYVLDVVLSEFMGLAWEARLGGDATEIALAGEQAGARLTILDGLFATPAHAWLTPRSLPPTPLAHWQPPADQLAPTLTEPDLPMLYWREPRSGAIVDVTGDRITIGLDLFGSIFFQLTRYEEIARPASDEHDRFPARASLAYREGLLRRPLVNEYVELLRSAIERLWPRIRTRRPAFEQRLSHDVDWPTHVDLRAFTVARSMVGDVARRGDAGLAVARLRAVGSRLRNTPTDDPYYSFDYIMDLSEERGLQSAFYFMAGRTDQRFDGSYELDDPVISALIRRIHERGHEIGLHPSYGTFREPSLIRAERDTLVRACDRLGVSQERWGGRQHFLRWENPVTWRAWEQADLTYDSSLGYSRHPGFRCGTCYEYPVFDLLAHRRLSLRERPLVVMDMSVIDTDGVPHRSAIGIVNCLRERCRMFGGQFTLLWHNSRLASSRERRLYRSTI